MRLADCGSNKFMNTCFVSDDIFLILLDMYKSSSNSLPTAPEVLICTEATTAEEVQKYMTIIIYPSLLLSIEGFLC